MQTAEASTRVNRPVPMSRDARLFLLFLSEINLVLGTLFYVYPGIGSTLWPWTVKPLAVRFLGAIFLAIAFGCWAAIRAKLWQRAKILLLVGGTFFGITLLVTIAEAATLALSQTVWPWTVFFVAATLGCLFLLWRHGWRREPTQLTSSEGLPILASVFFRFQTVIVAIFGTAMLLFPNVAHSKFWPWDVVTPCNCYGTLQTFAALFLATCLATGWASLQNDLHRIRVLLPLDAIFPSLALLAVGIHWNVLVGESPKVNGSPWIVIGVWVFVYAFVAVGSTLLYFLAKPRL